jgi:hypothetical protein
MQKFCALAFTQPAASSARKGIINDLLEGFESAAHVFVCEGGCGEAPNST